MFIVNDDILQFAELQAQVASELGREAFLSDSPELPKDYLTIYQELAAEAANLDTLATNVSMAYQRLNSVKSAGVSRFFPTEIPEDADLGDIEVQAQETKQTAIQTAQTNYDNTRLIYTKATAKLALIARRLSRVEGFSLYPEANTVYPWFNVYGYYLKSLPEDFQKLSGQSSYNVPGVTYPDGQYKTISFELLEQMVELHNRLAEYENNPYRVHMDKETGNLTRVQVGDSEAVLAYVNSFASHLPDTCEHCRITAQQIEERRAAGALPTLKELVSEGIQQVLSGEGEALTGEELKNRIKARANILSEGEQDGSGI